MKLIRVRFENFRLLRELELSFSTDSTKKLTVIRAENDTGKTTILNGLQWALYGDEGLPQNGKNYRIHPIDWDTSHSKRIPISVEVDFETTSRQGGENSTQTKKKYRIIRSADEEITGPDDWGRNESTVKLFHLDVDGSTSIDSPEAIIRDILPHELREVFFTDGDKALSFIEAEVSPATRRQRVEQAIRSLLGLGVIEDTIKHVKKSASDLNRAAKDKTDSSDLKQVLMRLEEIEKESNSLEDKIKDASTQFNEFDEKRADIRKKIETVLVKGDKEQLKNNINHTESELKKIREQCRDVAREHSELFKSLFLFRDMLGTVLEKVLEKLDDLHDQGEIPSTTIPVLEERLKEATCFCGESLDLNNPSGNRRREHIRHLIEDAQESDVLKSTLTDLYYGMGPLRPLGSKDGDEGWLDEYQKMSKRRDELETSRKENEKKLKALEVQLDKIPDTDIQGLRNIEREYINQRDRFNSDKSRHETRLEGLNKEKEQLISQRDSLLKEKEKNDFIVAQLEVMRDVEDVLNNSYMRVKDEELAKVSGLMNSIFLEMIGSDPDQEAIIQKSEISKDFNIVVYGPANRTLNPDRDLNGASRRALTLSFILALTKVSNVEAPNVIDTPLGMMSGYVKRSVLKTAIRESSQIILFLTRSEIIDCEEILDKETKSGYVITLTNPVHYPTMLVNDPKTKEHNVIRCECKNHDDKCTVCERRIDAEKI